MNHITHSRNRLFFLTGYDFHCDECTIGQIIKQKLHKRRIHCALRGVQSFRPRQFLQERFICNCTWMFSPKRLLFCKIQCFCFVCAWGSGYLVVEDELFYVFLSFFFCCDNRIEWWSHKRTERWCVHYRMRNKATWIGLISENIQLRKRWRYESFLRRVALKDDQRSKAKLEAGGTEPNINLCLIMSNFKRSG